MYQCFLRSVSQGSRNKIKINKWDLFKLTSFCTAKETINKRTAYGLEENICKWCDQQGLNFQNVQIAHVTQYQKNRKLSQKWAEDSSRYLFKEDIQMANRYKKRRSSSLILRETHIKNTVRYHLSLIIMAILKKSTSSKYWRGYGKPLLPCFWERKLVQPWWKTVWQFLKKTEKGVALWSSNPTPGNIPRENYNSKRSTRPYVYSSTVYNSQDMETT